MKFKNLNLGTPLTRDELKAIRGGTVQTNYSIWLCGGIQRVCHATNPLLDNCAGYSPCVQTSESCSRSTCA